MLTPHLIIPCIMKICSSKSLPIIIDMEADRMENLLLEPKAFEKERQVVLEERKQRYENSPWVSCSSK